MASAQASGELFCSSAFVVGGIKYSRRIPSRKRSGSGIFRGRVAYHAAPSESAGIALRTTRPPRNLLGLPQVPGTRRDSSRFRGCPWYATRSRQILSAHRGTRRDPSRFCRRTVVRDALSADCPPSAWYATRSRRIAGSARCPAAARRGCAKKLDVLSTMNPEEPFLWLGRPLHVGGSPSTASRRPQPGGYPLPRLGPAPP